MVKRRFLAVVCSRATDDKGVSKDSFGLMTLVNVFSIMKQLNWSFLIENYIGLSGNLWHPSKRLTTLKLQYQSWNSVVGLKKCIWCSPLEYESYCGIPRTVFLLFSNSCCVSNISACIALSAATSFETIKNFSSVAVCSCVTKSPIPSA